MNEIRLRSPACVSRGRRCNDLLSLHGHVYPPGHGVPL